MTFLPFTRMAIAKSIVIAFGLFFIGCSAPNQLIEDTKEHLDSGSLRLALQSANTGVNQEPDNPEMHFYKGLVHHQYANAEQTPSERNSHYENMVRSFNNTTERYETAGTRGRRSQEITYLITSSWTEEHNSAAAILKEESGPSHNQLRLAVDHLRNAVIIAPDSAISYELLAEAYIKLDDPQQALEAMQMAIELSDENKQGKNYERLAFLALNTGNYDIALEAYENIPAGRYDNVNVAHGLINIYQREEQPDKVVPIVQSLLEEDPGNIDYRKILASQLHKLSINRYERWLDKHPANPEISFSNHPDIIEARQFEQASIQQYESLIEERTNVPELRGNLGIVLQNTFFVKEQIAVLIEDEEKSTELKQEASTQLTTAINLLEEVAEVVEEPYLYWETLIQIFTHTGDQDKADKYIALLESAL